MDVFFNNRTQITFYVMIVLFTFSFSSTVCGPTCTDYVGFVCEKGGKPLIPFLHGLRPMISSLTLTTNYDP